MLRQGQDGRQSQASQLKGSSCCLGEGKQEVLYLLLCLPTMYGGMNCEGILVGILLMFQLLLHRSASSLVSVVEGNLLP